MLLSQIAFERNQALKILTHRLQAGGFLPRFRSARGQLLLPGAQLLLHFQMARRIVLGQCLLVLRLQLSQALFQGCQFCCQLLDLAATGLHLLGLFEVSHIGIVGLTMRVAQALRRAQILIQGSKGGQFRLQAGHLGLNLLLTGHGLALLLGFGWPQSRPILMALVLLARVAKLCKGLALFLGPRGRAL